MIITFQTVSLSDTYYNNLYTHTHINTHPRARASPHEHPCSPSDSPCPFSSWQLVTNTYYYCMLYYCIVTIDIIVIIIIIITITVNNFITVPQSDITVPDQVKAERERERARVNSGLLDPPKLSGPGGEEMCLLPELLPEDCSRCE